MQSTQIGTRSNACVREPTSNKLFLAKRWGSLTSLIPAKTRSKINQKGDDYPCPVSVNHPTISSRRQVTRFVRFSRKSQKTLILRSNLSGGPFIGRFLIKIRLFASLKKEKHGDSDEHRQKNNNDNSCCDKSDL